jgi:hypothetical protein
VCKKSNPLFSMIKKENDWRIDLQTIAGAIKPNKK